MFCGEREKKTKIIYQLFTGLFGKISAQKVFQQENKEKEISHEQRSPEKKTNKVKDINISHTMT